MNGSSDLVMIEESFGGLLFKVQLPYKHDYDHADVIGDDIKNHVITVVGEEHWNTDIEDTSIDETDGGDFEFNIEISTSDNDKQQLIYDKIVAAAKSFAPSEAAAAVLVKA